MNCPIDNTPLAITERQGIEIDYCPKCRGIWLDRGELDKLIERGAQYETRRDAEDDYRRDEQRGAVPGSYAPAQQNYPQGQPQQSSGPDIAGVVGGLINKGLEKRRQQQQYEGDYKRKKKGGFLDDLFDF